MSLIIWVNKSLKMSRGKAIAMAIQAVLKRTLIDMDTAFLDAYSADTDAVRFIVLNKPEAEILSGLGDGMSPFYDVCGATEVPAGSLVCATKFLPKTQ